MIPGIPIAVPIALTALALLCSGGCASFGKDTPPSQIMMQIPRDDIVWLGGKLDGIATVQCAAAPAQVRTRDGSTVLEPVVSIKCSEIQVWIAKLKAWLANPSSGSQPFQMDEFMKILASIIKVAGPLAAGAL